jgi:hypothetical protein
VASAPPISQEGSLILPVAAQLDREKEDPPEQEPGKPQQSGKKRKK